MLSPKIPLTPPGLIALKVSIIIPTLNEAAVIEKVLSYTQRLKPYEIILGDGGSTDNTLTIAGRFSPRVVTCPPGRGLQMNAAAGEALGDVLLFLHADSMMEPQGYAKMIELMARQESVGGAFSLKIDSDKLLLQLISRIATWRAKFFHIVYGDQAIFVRKDIFQRMGGFRPFPICEDLDFFRRLKKEGGVLILDEKAFTSPRRWIKEGILFTTARNGLIAILFLLGFSPKILSKWYLPVR
ncbi:MAG: TIGR04283 family arsenosugar biosynthesis glycosyltransferase [Nitrospinales bacterium]